MLTQKLRRLAALLVAGAAVLHAQDYTLRIDVPLIQLDVVVTDASGRTVSSLHPEDLIVTENGILQTLAHFHPATAAYNVLFLFDISGSTQAYWDGMIRSAGALAASLRDGDRISIAAFDDEYVTVLPWTDRRERAAGVTRPIRSKPGSTHFYDAVRRAVRDGFRGISGRRAVILMSDGRENSHYRTLVSTNRFPSIASEKPFQRVLQTVTERRIPVYLIALNTDLNQSAATGADEFLFLGRLYPGTDVPREYLREVRKRMEVLAEATGGRVLTPGTLEHAEEIYAAIGRELGSAFSIGYISNVPESSPDRVIAVKVRGKDLRVTQSRIRYRLEPGAQ